MTKFSSFMLGVASGYLLSSFFIEERNSSLTLNYPSHPQIIASKKKIDTIMIRQPIGRLRHTHQAEKVDIEICREQLDTIIGNNTPADTFTIALDREQYVYTDDSTYTAWISGVAPRLDSLTIMRPTVTTLVAAPYHKRHRWSISVSAGYAVTPQGATPYVGIGVSYNLVNF